jgi:hypothetical protein
MAEIQISKHAREQMKKRGISEEMVFEIVLYPDQLISEDSDKEIYQSVKYFEKDKREFLVRVFVNIIKQPNLVITVYRTTKIKKYWQDED